MKGDPDILDLLKSGIHNELDYQRALVLNRRLRNLTKTDSKYKKLRAQLLDLIEKYESQHWINRNSLTENKISQSDLAENIAELERSFIQKRKALIRSKLKAYDLTQQQLGELLGHSSKSYMSELMNGIAAFTLNDLVVIHRILGIKLDDLILTVVAIKKRKAIIERAKRLNNSKLNIESALNDESISIA